MTSLHFPLPLSGTFSEDGRSLTLSQPFLFEDKEKSILVRVPAGFQTDFNSVPRPLWGYFPPWQYPEAGVVHDWLYRVPNGFFRGSEQGWFPAEKPLSRGECDDIHRRILDLKGCRWGKRQLAYAALRAGGWRPWNRYRGENSPYSPSI